jgi:hypothetical protein
MTVQMQHVPPWAGTLERNLFEALLPTSWLSSVGIVDIAVSEAGGDNATNAVHLMLEVTPASDLSVKLIAGVLISTLVALLLAVLVWFVRRDPHHALELLKSYATYELLLGVEVSFELWDIFSGTAPFSIRSSEPMRAYAGLVLVVICAPPADRLLDATCASAVRESLIAAPARSLFGTFTSCLFQTV